MIVAPQARGRQLAGALMQRSLEMLRGALARSAVELGAQAHLSGFYASLGLRGGQGSPYDEDGILHVWMRRQLDAPGRRRPLRRVPILLAPRYWGAHLLMVLAVAAAVLLGIWQLHAWEAGRAAEARDLSDAAAAAAEHE